MKEFNPYDFYQAELHLKEPYIELNGYLNSMNLAGVDTWMVREDIRNNPDKGARLYEHIMQHSIVGFDKALNTEEDIKARDLAILRHFPFNTQLRLLENCFGYRFDSDYLAQLDFTDPFIDSMHAGNDYFFSQNLNIQDFGALIYGFFHRDDFTTLDLLQQQCMRHDEAGAEKKLLNRFFESLRQDVIVHLDNEFQKNNPVCYQITLSEPVFQMKDELVFSFNENKVQWLKKQGIELPTVEHIQEISTLFFKALENDDFYKKSWGAVIYGSNPEDELVDLWQQDFLGYRAKVLYHTLSKTIEEHYPSDFNHCSTSKHDAHPGCVEATRKIKI